jgi:hypothetical protein
MINNGEEINTARTLLFSINNNTEIIIKENTIVSLRDNELYRRKLG